MGPYEQYGCDGQQSNKSSLGKRKMWFRPPDHCQSYPLTSHSKAENRKEFQIKHILTYTVGCGPVTFHNQTGSNSWMKIRNVSGCFPVGRSLKSFQCRCRLTLCILKSKVPYLSNICIKSSWGQHQNGRYESTAQCIYRTEGSNHLQAFYIPFHACSPRSH